MLTNAYDADCAATVERNNICTSRAAWHFPFLLVTPQCLCFLAVLKPEESSQACIQHSGPPQSVYKETAVFTGAPTDLFTPLHADRAESLSAV